MKTSETKSRGRIEAFTTAGAASAFGMRVVTATPRQLKVAVPRRSVVRNDNAVLVGRDTSNRKDPIPVTMTTRRADIRVLWAILPNKNEKAGIRKKRMKHKLEKRDSTINDHHHAL